MIAAIAKFFTFNTTDVIFTLHVEHRAEKRIVIFIVNSVELQYHTFLWSSLSGQFRRLKADWNQVIVDSNIANKVSFFAAEE